MNRRETRELLMQTIFSMTREMDEKPILRAIEVHQIKGKEKRYFLDTFRLIADNIETIDQEISTRLTRWTLSRMPKADLAILRLAIGEGKFGEEVPVAVVINEAVNLGKKYGEESSGKFINGLLGNVFREE